MESITSDYVRGFADRSSQIVVRDCCIVLTARDRAPIAAVYVWLRDNGFQVSLRKDTRRGRYILRCSGRSSLENWRTKIGFLSPRLAQSLEQALKTNEVVHGSEF